MSYNRVTYVYNTPEHGTWIDQDYKQIGIQLVAKWFGRSSFRYDGMTMKSWTFLGISFIKNNISCPFPLKDEP